MSDDISDSAWRPPDHPADPVEALDGYTGLVAIGRGGDSVVYRAREAALGRDVAIKVLLVDDEKRVARFAREVQISVDLGRQHPNIVTILATGTTASGRPAIVMDLAEGGTLHDRLVSHGPLPAEEVGRIGEVLADALAFAHARGVLHRDVKPQNVLVLPTSWVLTDFGIARLAGSEHTDSAEHFTYRHAAPQILDGQPPTAADDIWSLGSTLYTLLDGRPPFASDDVDEDSALAYLRRARTEPYRPLTTPGSERIAPIIDRCLAKDVAERWPSAEALRDALAGLRSSAWAPRATTATVAPGAPAEPDRTPTAPRSVTPAPAPPAPAVPAAVPSPPPVALSVAAHAPVERDDAPTGVGRPDQDATGAPPSGPEAPAPAGAGDTRGPSQRRTALVLGGIALVVGLALGVGGAILRNDDPETTPKDTPAPTGADIPSLSTSPTSVPTFSGDPNPKLAVVLTRLDAEGASGLDLAWTDPSKGEGTFVLHQVAPDADLVATFPAGSTRGETVHALPAGRSCYFLTVHLVDGDFGVSNRRCVDRES